MFIFIKNLVEQAIFTSKSVFITCQTTKNLVECHAHIGENI